MIWGPLRHDLTKMILPDVQPNPFLFQKLNPTVVYVSYFGFEVRLYRVEFSSGWSDWIKYPLQKENQPTLM